MTPVETELKVRRGWVKAGGGLGGEWRLVEGMWRVDGRWRVVEEGWWVEDGGKLKVSQGWG